MTSSSQDYKASARSVQRSSQELLSRLRNERLAKKPRKSPLVDADGPVSPTLPEPASAEESDRLAHVVASAAVEIPAISSDSASSRAEGVAIAKDTEGARPAPAENASDRVAALQSLPEADLPRDPRPTVLSRERIIQAISEAVDRAPFAEAFLALLQESKAAMVVAGEPVPGPESVAIRPTASAAFEPAAHPAKAAKPLDHLPLDHLPMIGPGLRWRLSQLGVETLDDLVAADLAELKTQLGEIGRLINLATWVNAARVILDEGSP